MSAIPPTIDDHETNDEVWAPRRDVDREREREPSSRFEYAFGRWFATLVEPEFVLA